MNFAIQCRLAGIPDTFVDIFQGRSPTSVLGQYYTHVGAKELRSVYDKIELKLMFKPKERLQEIKQNRT